MAYGPRSSTVRAEGPYLPRCDQSSWTAGDQEADVSCAAAVSSRTIYCPGPAFGQHGDLSGHATAGGWAGVRLGPWLVLVRLTASLAEVLLRAGTASARP